MRMMQLDFWNNPLVVSALRLRFRRNSPGLRAALYVAVLAVIGMTIAYNADDMPRAPARIFLLILMGLQLAITVLFGATSVGTSLHQEVMNRTLDFQRIVSLSPREILVGKMIGEPVTIYFMAMATIPFAVICWALGAVTFWALLLLYVNLATCSLMLCSVGLVHTLSAPSQANSTQKMSGGAGFLIAPFFVLPYLLINGLQWMANPWIAAPINTLTPLGSLMEMLEGNAFAAQVSFWGFSLPSLVVAPLAQLAIMQWVVASMANRLKRPVEPPVSRGSAYLALLVFDVLVAGVCYNQFVTGIPAGEVLIQFCLVHGLGCLIMVFAISPSQAALSSWLWRYREKQQWLRSSLWKDRAENAMALVVFCAIGIGVLAVSWGVVAWSGGAADINAGTLIAVAAVTSLLILALGTAYQAMVATMGKSGAMWFILLLILANVVPPILAALAGFDSYGWRHYAFSHFLMSLSPAFYYGNHLTEFDTLALHHVGLAIAYTVVLLVSWSVLRRWIRFQKLTIDRTLTRMKADSQS